MKWLWGTECNDPKGDGQCGMEQRVCAQESSRDLV